MMRILVGRSTSEAEHTELRVILGKVQRFSDGLGGIQMVKRSFTLGHHVPDGACSHGSPGKESHRSEDQGQEP